MIRLLHRFLRLHNHDRVRRDLAQQEKLVRDNERRLEHLRRERALYSRRGTK